MLIATVICGTVGLCCFLWLRNGATCDSGLPNRYDPCERYALVQKVFWFEGIPICITDLCTTPPSMPQKKFINSLFVYPPIDFLKTSLEEVTAALKSLSRLPKEQHLLMTALEVDKANKRFPNKLQEFIAKLDGRRYEVVATGIMSQDGSHRVLLILGERAGFHKINGRIPDPNDGGAKFVRIEYCPNDDKFYNFDSNPD